jgi:hypothetical protein
MSSSTTRLQEQNRGQIARSLILLLILDIVLAFAMVSSNDDPGAVFVHDLLRYLFGLVSLVVVFYFGHHLKKRRSALHELRIEARLRIQSRDGTSKHKRS